jgi:hypothetical protein
MKINHEVQIFIIFSLIYLLLDEFWKLYICFKIYWGTLIVRAKLDTYVYMFYVSLSLFYSWLNSVV